MLFMIIIFSVSFMLPMMILLITLVVSMRSNNDREKLSPFECGFDPSHSARIPFSMRFFLLAIIFIVFDIEIVLLIPIPMILFSYQLQMTFSLIMFLLILLIGLLHEWNQNSLNWNN